MKFKIRHLAILLISVFIFNNVNARLVIPDAKIDRILILKDKRKMYLLSGDVEIREYDMSLGFAPKGHKEKQGDGKTPEGIYKISGRNPQSLYHKSLRISYPNDEDKRKARARGVNPGGDIMIHGLPNGYGFIGKDHLDRDWTLGCVAVTNPEIEEIWDMVSNGTIVEIKP